MKRSQDEEMFLKDLETSYLKDTSQIIQTEIDFSSLQKKIFNLLKRFDILESFMNKGVSFETYQKNFLILLTEGYSLVMRLTESLKKVKFNYLLFIEGKNVGNSLLREYTLEEILNINGLLKVTNDAGKGIRLMMKKISSQKLKEKGNDFGTSELRESILNFYQSLEGLLYSTQKGRNKKASQKIIKSFQKIQGSNKKEVSQKRREFKNKYKVSSVLAGPQFETAVNAALEHLEELQKLSGVKLQKRLINFYSTDSAIFYSRGDITLKNATGEIEKELQLKNLSTGMAQVVRIDTLKKTLTTISYYILTAEREQKSPTVLVSDLLKKEDKISKIWSEEKEKVVKAELDKYFKEYINS